MPQGSRLPSELLVSRAGGRTSTALREDGATVELRIEDDRTALAVGDIVKARVSKILPGIQSAFLDAGQDRDAFLHVSDLLLPGEPLPVEEPGASAADDAGEGRDGEPDMPRRPVLRGPSGPPIEDRLKEGREVVVQVVREAFGGKGPRVTCFITLPGRYLVHAPQNSFRGVSRRIHDPGERQRLREILAGLADASGGFIVRTAGQGAAAEAFEADASLLARTWSAIARRIQTVPAPGLVHSDLDLFLRSLRDAAEGSLDRIVVDDDRLYAAGLTYLNELDPSLAARLARHEGAASLFDVTGVAQDLERSLRPRVWLKSGGTIVIEQTEALVSIDVNTGKSGGQKRPDETVFKTNLEAADEIARQLRLRDLGGIIVVDFIDMERADHKLRVIAALEEALRRDRSRTKVVGLSELGLLQLTRKRTRLGLTASLTRPCGFCAGAGRMKTPETVAYEALFEVGRVAPLSPSGTVTVRTHPDVARALRLTLQTASPIVDQGVVSRLNILEDDGARPDQFDVKVG
jgi:ribonuclease G